MMETKLWFALCALLVINLGSAKHDNNQTDSTTSTLKTEAAPTVLLGASSLSLTDQPSPAPDHLNTNTSRNDTSSLSSNMTTGGETTSLKPEAKIKNDTNTVTPSLGDNNRNLTNNLTTQPPVQSLGSQDTASHILPIFTPTNPPHVTRAAPSNTTNTTLSTNTSTSVPPKQTNSSTSAPAPEPPKTHHSNATVSTKSTSTSSSGSSQEHASPETHTVTAPHTPQAEQTKSTVSPSAQAKAHVNTPSQLNVGGGTTMVHESPTLDPLLAGLVSAFIVTAVIITLLLFLKLRRRDNRPEFRRLQDLPMDDMMEDTPLSMYTY